MRLSFLYENALSSPNNSVIAESWFAFDLQSPSSGSGDFEYCSEINNEISTEGLCAEELARRPDGVVTVAVSASSMSKIAVEIDYGEQHILLLSKDLQYGLIARDFELSPDVVDAIRTTGIRLKGQL